VYTLQTTLKHKNTVIIMLNSICNVDKYTTMRAVYVVENPRILLSKYVKY